jgi:hypothetical protein
MTEHVGERRTADDELERLLLGGEEGLRAGGLLGVRRHTATARGPGSGQAANM